MVMVVGVEPGNTEPYNVATNVENGIELLVTSRYWQLLRTWAASCRSDVG